MMKGFNYGWFRKENTTDRSLLVDDDVEVRVPNVFEDIKLVKLAWYLCGSVWYVRFTCRALLLLTFYGYLFMVCRFPEVVSKQGIEIHIYVLCYCNLTNLTTPRVVFH